MRIVTWNCNMALHRKADVLLRLKPDIAIIQECATPEILCQRGAGGWFETEPVWIGDNPNKGLGVFTFNGFSVELHEIYHRTLKHIAPVVVDGPVRFNLLAVWAQNASGGNTRKHQSGPLRRALGKYREFLTDSDTIVAGDLNNNVIWDRRGWRINHLPVVARLDEMGLISAYHAVKHEAQGEESIPTHYWRDRRKDGPTYHIDYVFMPQRWLGSVRHFSVGDFENWCGSMCA